VSRLPLLGSLPVVGLLFRSKKSPVANTETELVVSLTPTILKQRKQATAKAPGSSTEALIPSETMETYLRDLQERISEAVTYPPEMEDRGAEGIVDLSLHLREDGRLKDASIVRSSGYDGFDKDALNTAKRLSPYPAFPQPGLKEYTATIPVIYRKPQTSRSIIPQQMKYLEEIQQKIATSVIYPQEAKEFGWEGTVKVALHILNDGTLVYASIRESSGYDLLDEDALKTVKMLAPYSVFPSGLNLQELNVTVPIVYSSIEK
jgi:TonB family protein